MNEVANIVNFLVRNLATMYLALILLRLLLQLVRANFYNPVSQFTVKLTNPLLRPLRRFIPPLGIVDTSSIVLALLFQLVVIEALALISGVFISPVQALIWGALGIAKLIVSLFFICILVSFIVSWVAPYSQHPVLEVVRSLLEPILSPFRRLIPPIGGLDISPMFAMLAILTLHRIIDAVGKAVNLLPNWVALVPGYV